MPSRASSERATRVNSSRRYRRAAPYSMPLEVVAASLATASAVGEKLAMVRASSSTVAASSVRGTTRLTSPMSPASCALTCITGENHEHGALASHAAKYGSHHDEG